MNAGGQCIMSTTKSRVFSGSVDQTLSGQIRDSLGVGKGILKEQFMTNVIKRLLDDQSKGTTLDRMFKLFADNSDQINFGWPDRVGCSRKGTLVTRTTTVPYQWPAIDLCLVPRAHTLRIKGVSLPRRTLLKYN